MTFSKVPHPRSGGSTVNAGLPFLILAAVAYGSLLPFNLCLPRLGQIGLDSLLRPAFAATSWDDLLTNLLIYMPVGFSWNLALRSWIRRSVAAVAVATVVGTLWSLLLELLQATIPSRVPSWMDVIVNGTGTLVGSLLFALGPFVLHGLYRKFGTALECRPLRFFAFVVFLGLLVGELAPFDFISTSDQLHTAFRRAEWFGIAGSLWTRLPEELTNATWFGVASGLLAADRHLENCRAHRAITSSIAEAMTLAILIENLQLFVGSHVFSLATVVVRLILILGGAIIGASYGANLSYLPWRIRPSHLAPTSLILLFIGFRTIPIAINICTSASICRLEASTWSAPFLPFYMLWQGGIGHAIYRLLDESIMVAALALPVSILARRAGSQRPWRVASLAVVLTEALRELFPKTGFPIGQFDATNLVWSLGTIWVIVRAYPALRFRLTSALVTREVGEPGSK